MTYFYFIVFSWVLLSITIHVIVCCEEKKLSTIGKIVFFPGYIVDSIVCACMALYSLAIEEEDE